MAIRLNKKALTLLITICLIAQSATATAKANNNRPILLANISKSLKPSECLPLNLPCICYLPQAIDKIADGLIELEICRSQLELYEDYTEEFTDVYIPEKPWYEETEYKIGGLIVSVSVGVLLGYRLNHK